MAAAAAAAEDRYPRAAEAYLVKRDGRVLWAGAEDRPMAPASLTKMMTALLVLERNALSEVVTVSRAAARETGSRIGLSPGDQLLAYDLLAAAVVRSANDACRALADHVGASFVARMNERARSLGLVNTHFVDPCGHDRPGQYSTAADLARIAEQVMRHPEYVRLARIPRMRIATLDGQRKFELTTTNALIDRYPGVLGVKTGSTSRAGHCLVVLAEKNGVKVLVVLLNAPNRWWNAVGLLDRAFEARAL